MAKPKKETNDAVDKYIVKNNDKTADFEKDILKENPGRVSYLVKLFRYVFSSASGICATFLGLAVLLSLLQPLTAFIWGRYIDAASRYTGLSNISPGQWTLLIGLAVLYWLIGYIGAIINRYVYGGEDIERLSKVQSHRLQEKFQAKLFSKIARLYPDYMEVPRINDIIKRSFDSMGGEWSSLQRGVIIEGYVIIAKVVSVLAVAAALFIYNPLLCFIVLIAPLPTLYTAYVGNKLAFKFTRNNTRLLREAGYYQEVLLDESAKEVKALNLFDFFFGKWKTHADEYVVKEKKNLRNIYILSTASGLVYNIAGIAANVFAIVLMTNGSLTIGGLGAVFALNTTLIAGTSALFRSVAAFLSKKNEAAQFFELIDLDEQSATDGGHFNNGFETLEARNVSYRYPLTDEYRIKDISFLIRKGEKIAFVGENGAGKTTFVKLLTGMLVPSSGGIHINGQDAEDICHKDRYNIFSHVFQEPSRFNTFTIGDNVFLGDVGVERDRALIDSALSFSGFNIRSQDELLGKDIGGIELSGGEWQKLAIARAGYRDRAFIILDEPTSNLDPLAEAEVFKKYLEMAAGKTVIMVTHRISVASLADRVIVFKDGRIVGDGSHLDLVAGNSEYARLYLTQARWYDR